MENSSTVWKSKELAQLFLDDVRSAIPLAAEQIDVMMRIIRAFRRPVGSFLDLGCGDGILGREILKENPKARAVFVDFSETMIEAARKNLGKRHDARVIFSDFGKKGWIKDIREYAPFDVVVSGFAIHHHPDTRKKEIYREIYSLLAPGGVFLNMEHVSPVSPEIEKVLKEMFVDNLHLLKQRKGFTVSRAKVAKEYYDRPDKDANILTPAETQVRWLKQIGFESADCFFRIFELALFGGVKPQSKISSRRKITNVRR